MGTLPSVQYAQRPPKLQWDSEKNNLKNGFAGRFSQPMLGGIGSVEKVSDTVVARSDVFGATKQSRFVIYT
jgi:hypothetical protein